MAQSTYLLARSPVEVDPCDKENAILLQDGECVDDVVAPNTSSIHNCPVPLFCAPDNMPSDEYQKLCELGIDLSASLGDILAALNDLDVTIDGDVTVDNKFLIPTQMTYPDPNDASCVVPVYICTEGSNVTRCVIINPDKTFTDVDMLKVTTTNAGNSAKVCETLDVQLEITEPGEGTAADLIADAIASGLAFPTYGAPVAEDALAISGQAAGPVVYGGQTGDCIADTEGVSASTAFDFTDPTCLPVNLNVCFRKCLTAAEAKAAAEKG